MGQGTQLGETGRRGEFVDVVDVDDEDEEDDDRVNGKSATDVYTQILQHMTKTSSDVIPDLFTLDLDNLLPEEDECRCARCGWWFDAMRRKYAYVFFCARFTQDEEDFRFFPSRGVEWNTQQGREPLESDSLVFSEDSESIDGESEIASLFDSGLVICLGCDEPLGVSTANNRVHVRIGRYDNREETVFTISHEIWHRAKECLRVCRDEHDRCRYRSESTQASGFKPTRLIDTGQDDDGPPRLVRGPSLTAEDIKTGYVALNYCWGGDNEQKTTTQNIETRYEDDFPLKSQPATIQDAITVITKMGFCYLWIDNRHMRRAPHLLISVSRASTAAGGFLQHIIAEEVEETEIKLSIPFKHTYQAGTGRIVLVKWFPSRADLTPEPIHSRA
ncbi:hypothetical protein F5B22DRAFT_660410 [Xylaria bambusicola]|uniref:uncharacterized protein n=1 Tax=Xylaria bambusicola TaxID=326684 RepID=UPI0020084E27|nr:uncharacterized protein F5B22DRAFT_660410 [Xylaria bambusicola]KAI0506328.1 hypothetical protein F5B22DRAFT_660410 [Xylaria bambusicola]